MATAYHASVHMSLHSYLYSKAGRGHPHSQATPRFYLVFVEKGYHGCEIKSGSGVGTKLLPPSPVESQRYYTYNKKSSIVGHANVETASTIWYTKEGVK